MAQYAGITFGTRIESGGFAPEADPEPLVSITQIPYSGITLVQTGGQGMDHWQFTARFASVADYRALKALVCDGVPRTFVDAFGETHSNVKLIGLRQRKRHPSGVVLAEIELQQAGV
jgi:hypothetical protein